MQRCCEGHEADSRGGATYAIAFVAVLREVPRYARKVRYRWLRVPDLSLDLNADGILSVVLGPRNQPTEASLDIVGCGDPGFEPIDARFPPRASSVVFVPVIALLVRSKS